ncbi:MAG: class I SAM-dependent methyltransferase, partial [Methanococcoides sp.]|nr:class I SAM-dependent methyltransferase [Methanococcoides sp.]
MVPYKEKNRTECHKTYFDEHFFQNEIGEFEKIFFKVIDTKSSGFWHGNQLLIVYKKKSIVLENMDEVINMYANSQSSQLWDKVAETYVECTNDSEVQLGNEIEQMLLDLGVKPRSSLLEVGCGSGHLSGYLATKGFKTTLLDFSKVALDKAKKHYDDNNLKGGFINADMLNLSTNIVDSHDVVWNSGVLEHFSAWDVIDVLRKMGEVARQYVIVLVPNSKSIPYLLFRRHAMETDEWAWGRELLRDSLKHLAEAAGLEVLEERYLGNHFSQDHFNYINPIIGQEYQNINLQKLISNDQNYLIALIARPKKEDIPLSYEKILKNVIQKESSVENSTYYFDFSAVKSRLENIEKLNPDLNSQIEAKNSEVLDLNSHLEAKNSEVLDL